MTDRAVVCSAVAVAAGAWAALPLTLWGAVAVVGLAVVFRRPWILALALAAVASTRAATAWQGLDGAPGGPYDGWVTLASDPEPFAGGVAVLVRDGHHRYDGWITGSSDVDGLLLGERIRVSGLTMPLPDHRLWLRPAHVAARMEIDEVIALAPGAPVTQAANGLRRTLDAGSRSLGAEHRALFAGLVLGDDRGQSPDTIEAFRATGLAHLLAVSGQNVAYVLVLVRPLSRRLSLGGRWGLTIAVVGFFALVTRFEPSVLRASAMAGLAATAGLMGRRITGARLLALAVTGLLIVDPLLVRSIGFRLSVGASAGILALGSRLAEAVPGPETVRALVATSLAAQIGVAPVLAATFGGVPVVAIPANVIAAPAAGPVMMWGLSAGLVAGVVGEPLAGWLHVPTDLGIGWIAGVARVAASLPIAPLGPAAVAATGLGGALWLTRHRFGPAARACLPVLGVVSAVAVASALVARPTARARIDGAVVWTSDGSSIVEVTDVVSPVGLLADLRAAGVSHVGVLVARDRAVARSPAVAAVRDRYSPSVFLEPGRVPPEAEAEAVVVGGLEVVVADPGPPVAVLVRGRVPSARAPPAR